MEKTNRFFGERLANLSALSWNHPVSVNSLPPNSGRNDENYKVIFPKEDSKEGDYVNVLIEKFTSATLIGKII